MKKIKILAFIFIMTIALLSGVKALAYIPFSEAIKNCEPYSKQGFGNLRNEKILINVSLEKKFNQCIYKEKITQGIYSNIITCNFKPEHLQMISEYMKAHSQKYYKEIAQDPIIEAKMTSSEAVLEHFLSNPKYCKIEAVKG